MRSSVLILLCVLAALCCSSVFASESSGFFDDIGKQAQKALNDGVNQLNQLKAQQQAQAQKAIDNLKAQAVAQANQQANKVVSQAVNGLGNLALKLGVRSDQVNDQKAKLQAQWANQAQQQVARLASQGQDSLNQLASRLTGVPVIPPAPAAAAAPPAPAAAPLPTPPAPAAAVPPPPPARSPASAILPALRRELRKQSKKKAEVAFKKGKRQISKILKRAFRTTKVTDAPVGASIADLQKYSSKKVVLVKPRGIGAQLPGDRENNEDAIAATKFDLRWAKTIKEKTIKEGDHLLPKIDRVNSKFIDFTAKNTRLPLIAPELFNSRR